MVEVGVGEYPVDPAAHRPQLGHAALLEQVSQGLAWREGQHVRAGPDLDGDPAGEVLVAVEETCCPVQCVPSVIYEYNDHYPDCELVLTFAHQMRMMKDILLTTYCWALLWCFVRRTQEYPLLCCSHLPCHS